MTFLKVLYFKTLCKWKLLSWSQLWFFHSPLFHYIMLVCLNRSFLKSLQTLTSRQLCKPSTLSRVCITVSNSPNPSCIYIRLCKHGKRFLLLKYIHCNSQSDSASFQAWSLVGGQSIDWWYNAKYTPNPDNIIEGTKYIEVIKSSKKMRASQGFLGTREHDHLLFLGQIKYFVLHRSNCRVQWGIFLVIKGTWSGISGNRRTQ